MKDNPLTADLDHILDHTRELWDELRGERIFITGGTGFFGCWLLESFLWANKRLRLKSSAAVLTRDPMAFKQKVPHIGNADSIHFLVGDGDCFVFPEGNYPFIIHAATDTRPLTTPDDAINIFQHNIQMTSRVLEFAQTHQTKKLLFTSSGAVYGKQSANISHIPEDYAGAPDPLNINTAYGQSKRASEFLCTAAASDRFEVKIGRCFAFMGPYLPINSNYAVGNFIHDVINGRPITISGDGTPLRSYLYASDLAIWLWTILLRGKSGTAYNVGSDQAVSIRQLASEIANRTDPRVDIQVLTPPTPGAPIQQYVPSIELAKKDLGLQVWMDRPASIEKTFQYYLKTRGG
jgi:dTDP-glucose 4,6-dehydratase